MFSIGVLSSYNFLINIRFHILLSRKERELYPDKSDYFIFNNISV